MHISWTRKASFCHLGVISDPLIVLKFYNETHDPKGQENKIYTIVRGRELLQGLNQISDAFLCTCDTEIKMNHPR